MPLRPCPACSNEVSLEAAACPKCGHQFKAAGGISLSDPVHVLGIVLVVIVVGAIVLVAIAAV